MKVVCYTNLDAFQRQGWPTDLPCVPSVGDYIEASKPSKKGYIVELVVSSVKWKYIKGNVRDWKSRSSWVPYVELHLPTGTSILTLYQRHGEA